jgi:hypothetical protein
MIRWMDKEQVVVCEAITRSPWHDMEVNMRVRIRLVVLTASLGLIAGCEAQITSPTQTPKAVSAAKAAVRGRIQHCPGQDFATFLKMFASDELVRDRFTLPTVSVVDYADPAGGGGDSDRTEVFKVPRSEYRQFTLRYGNGSFHHSDADGKIEPDAIDVRTEKKGSDYLVGYSYGMSEGNSWLFKYRDHCWYLAEDPEAPFE